MALQEAALPVANTFKREVYNVPLRDSIVVYARKKHDVLFLTFGQQKSRHVFLEIMR